ncbi:MAG: tetratricopeptide repeat protein [Candidatus Omnitrophica bacterium]|nr:tetratricopeptide repeat protein [Candidatus Omnitrophota bacterium]
MRLTLLGLIILPLFTVFSPHIGFTDTVILKSGKTIEGKIVEKTNEYIKIDAAGMPLYYEHKYIREIEEGAGQAGREAPDYFKKGLELAKDAEFTKAEAELKSGLRLDPEDKNISAALSLIEDVHSGIAPQEYAANLFNGYYSLLNEQYRQAAGYFQKALESNVYDADIRYNLASAYYSLKEYPLAIEQLEKALKLRSEDAEACSLLASAYYMTGEPSKAKAYSLISQKLSREMHFNP